MQFSHTEQVEYIRLARGEDGAYDDAQLRAQLEVYIAGERSHEEI